MPGPWQSRAAIVGSLLAEDGSLHVMSTGQGRGALMMLAKYSIAVTCRVFPKVWEGLDGAQMLRRKK